MRAEQGRAEITCQYCNTHYEVSGEELATMAAALMEN
jgi:redox-regulated HSP33 family molecular chaperone